MVSEGPVQVPFAVVSEPLRAEQYCGELSMLTSWPPGRGERDTGVTGKIQLERHTPCDLHPPAKAQLPKSPVSFKLSPPTGETGSTLEPKGNSSLNTIQLFLSREYSLLIFNLIPQWSEDIIWIISIELLETSFMALNMVLLDEYVMNFWSKYAFCCLVLCKFILD